MFKLMKKTGKVICLLFLISTMFFAVSCSSKTELSTISVKSTAHKTEYWVGEKLSVSDLVIELEYTDGVKKDISVTESMVSGFETSVAQANQVITITYEGKTTSYNIKIAEPEILSIAIKSTAHKTEYWVGEKLSVSDLVVEGLYTDGVKKDISVTESMVSGFETSVAQANQAITITYEGKTTSYNIKIAEPEILSIAIKSTAHKTEYWVGEKLSVSDLVVEGLYTDGTKKDISVTESMVSGFETSVAQANQVITITYEGKTTSYNIVIVEPKVTSIKISSVHHDKMYYVGESLDVKNLYIEAKYNNGTSKSVMVDKSMVTGFDSSKAASIQTLTIHYKDNITTYDITIYDIRLITIQVKSYKHKISYFVGEELDVSNLIIELNYNNGTKKEVAVLKDMVSGFNSSVANDTQILTIDYEGLRTTFNIRIKQILLNSISLKSTKYKLSYKIGEKLDVTGCIIKATYNNGETAYINVEEGMVTGFNSSVTETRQELTINYNGLKITYFIAIKSTDAYSITEVSTYDLNGNPYTDPILQFNIDNYNGSYIELNEDYEYTHLSITITSSMNSWVVSSGDYQLENDTLILKPTYGYEVKAEFIEGKIIIKEKVNGSYINGTKYPDYIIAYTYSQQ